MRDIRRPYHNSKFSDREIVRRIPSISSKDSAEISKKAALKAEMYERNEYASDIDYTREGKPVMRASSHFDIVKGMNKKKKDDFDVLKREEFFNSKKRQFDKEEVRQFKRARKKKRGLRRIFVYSVISLAFFGILATTFIFDSSKVIVNPKYKDIDVSDTFLIFKEDILIDTATSSLSKTVLKSEPKQINQKATGEITIYNNYSASPQILITNTRFQTKDGKIFRIGESVIVPGMTGSTPGSIKVKVSADSYGSEYNIPASDFTIPGFKDTSRYTGFYAKSSESMTGGASGMVQTVAKDDVVSATNLLTPDLNENLKKIYSTFNHDGYYTLYGSPLTSYTDNATTLTSSDENSYKLLGTANIISIKKDVLARMIAKQVLQDEYIDSENVKLDNIDNLFISVDPATTLDSNVFKIVINGKARIIWDFDKQAFKSDLAGKKKAAFDSVIKNYNYAILNATYKLFPIWIQSFPNSISKIKIIEEVK